MFHCIGLIDAVLVPAVVNIVIFYRCICRIDNFENMEASPPKDTNS